MNESKRKIRELEDKIELLRQENKKLQSDVNGQVSLLQQEHESLFHNPHLGIFQYNETGVITNCNDVFVQIIGSSKEALIGLNMITQLNDQKMINCVKEVLVKGKSYYEDDYRSVTGKKLSTVKVHFTAVRNKANAIVGGIGIVEDITRQKEAEQLLKQTKEQLKVKLDYILSPDADMSNIELQEIIDIEQLQKIQDAFAYATDVASLIVDIHGNPITRESNFNRVCSMIRDTEEGLKRCKISDTYIGKRAMETLQPVYEKCKSCGFYDAGAPIIIGNKHIATWTIGQVKTEDLSVDEVQRYAAEIGLDPEIMKMEFIRIQRTSTEKFENVLNLLWILTKEISTMAYNNIKLARSIEKHKVYEKELKLAKEKAEDSDRLKTSFLANMSHEIRTPMNAIIGFTDLLGDPNLTVEQREQFIEIINSSGNDLLHLIDDIIDIAKIEANQLNINLLEFNVNHVIEELQLIYENKANKENRDIKIVGFSGLPNDEAIIYSDKNRIKQILVNLLNNAFKFTNEGEIRFGYEKESTFLKFFVKDSGIGIPPELREIIFERFRQGSEGSVKKFGGTGLGLSISKGLVELLGGKIWLNNDETSQGATFYFTIAYGKKDK